MARKTRSKQMNVDDTRLESQVPDGPPLAENHMAGPIELARQRLGLIPSNELITWMKENPRTWLIEGVIPEGTVGVCGASAKSGKTWVAVDLAIAVATGGKWLGRFPVHKPGPVVLYPGECGGAPLAQRFEAVQDSCSLEHVPNVYCGSNIPNISNLVDLTVVREQILRIKPVLVILDSIYLAIPDVDTKNIASVGAALYPLQQICNEVGAALLLTHHWNETGRGNGADRFSGAGWNAWGRFLISMRASKNHATESRSEVDLDFILTGSEVSEQEWRIRRTIHRVDPTDINSPLVYQLGDAPPSTLTRSKPNSAQRLEHALSEIGQACTIVEIMNKDNDICVKRTPPELPLKEDTVRKRLGELVKSGKIKKAIDDAQVVRYVLNTQINEGVKFPSSIFSSDPF